MTLQQPVGERRRQDEPAEKGKRINEVKAELLTFTESKSSPEELQMIRALLKKFPLDAEDVKT